jgi:hypothetical protein
MKMKVSNRRTCYPNKELPSKLLVAADARRAQVGRNRQPEYEKMREKRKMRCQGGIMDM